MSRIFQSSFSQHFTDFIKLRRVSGLDYSSQEALLLKFDKYLFKIGRTGILSFNDVQDFLETEQAEKSFGQKARMYQIIRHFYDYLAVFFPQQPNLPIGEYRRNKSRPIPKIFTEEELALLLKESKKISRHNEIRNKTLHAALSLAIACGLRRSEIANLRLQDVNLDDQKLFINETKFGKSRIIPIGDDLCKILCDYISFRQQKYPLATTEKFFITLHKTGLSGGWHWYQAGKDVQSLLPALASYMGHEHYSNTAYYFTMTAELLGIAVDNFDSVWKSEVLNEED